MNTVLALDSIPPPARRRRQPTRETPAVVAVNRRLSMSLAACSFALAITILAISMPHLKDGAVRICHCTDTTGWLIAIVFDLSQILAEVCMLAAATAPAMTGIQRPCKTIIACSSAVSIALNVDAFLLASEGTTKAIISAWIAGVLLPLGVLAFCYVGSRFWIAMRPRENPRSPIQPDDR